MAHTVFFGRELEVQADELPSVLAAGHLNTGEELDMFLHLSDSESRSTRRDESRETSPLPLPSSVELAIATPEKIEQNESTETMEPALVQSSAKKPKAVKKTKTTKQVKAATKTPQRRHRRQQSEIYGTTAPRRSSRAHTAPPVKTPRATTKKASGPKAKAPQKRGRKSSQGGAKKKQNSTSGEQWEVESIIDSQIDADTLEHFYKVKWRGYSAKENTWEPKSNLVNCQSALKQYELKKKKQAVT